MSISHSRDLRLLAGAAGISALGDFMAIFPVVLHVQQRTGSAFAVSALIFALWGPVVLTAGVAGALVDRFENRCVLIVASLGQAAVVSGMLAGIDNLWALLPLMMLLGFGVAVSQPAEFALVPAAAGPETDAARSNGLMETTRSIGFTAGPVVGGALGAAGLLWLALALNAVSFVLVAAAAAAIRARRRPDQGADAPASGRSREGFAFLVRERDIAITLGGAIAALAVFSISATAEPFFVTDSLRAGSLAYGILLTSWTLGMAAGSAGLAHRVGRAQVAAGALAAVVLQGFGIAGASLAPVLWVALIGFVFGGVSHGVKNVLLRTLIHERVPDALRGRAFAAYNGARNGAELGALVLGGFAVGALGARAALLLAGLGPAAIGTASLLLLANRRRRVAVAMTTTNEGRVLHARVQR
ncbi:MAG TPA: MFS transporter [Solirubrobacteraceae bacterium]|nr:MFS transporter [Solirubrobacteraceae bacterium]